ncbi:hypothetical protein Gogos_005035 [Gossypium gossypioides]|uniref:Uncharacterized protein n=1 Tax=Gossypium gossypioides TaxID=34282 RepID=A0A7J9CIJ2_GOSGO|nr:hypothetical protein [Gossypium gossypioides]
MNVSLGKENSTVCMVENVDPNAGISSKIMKDGGHLLLHRKGSSIIPSDTSLHGSCFGSKTILGDETHAKEGESRPKIRPKGVVDGQQMNISILPLVGLEGWRRLG